MKSTELRVGNLVNWGVNVCEIKGIHTQSIGQTENRDHHFYVSVLNNKNMNYYCFMPNEIEPIELTPQWLERLGFKHLGGNFKTWTIEYNFLPNLKRTIFVEGDKGFCVYIEGQGIAMDEDKFISISWVYNVHQLQNLYFALTQTELTLKP